MPGWKTRGVGVVLRPGLGGFFDEVLRGFWSTLGIVHDFMRFATTN